jgi:hypothetical protein
MNILAIDPGSEKSAYVLFNGTIKSKDIVYNLDMRELLYNMRTVDRIVIEMVASYGMPVGREVFETVMWIGRFYEAAMTRDIFTSLIYRKEIKIHLCGSMKAKDANIRQALIDKIGPQGLKKSPGPTYGIRKDEWSALAVAVTYWESLDAQGKGWDDEDQHKG